MPHPWIVSVNHQALRVKSGVVHFSAAAVIVVFFAGCGHDDYVSSPERVEAMTASFAKNTWVVTIYKDQEIWRTEIFAGYTFTFQREGTSHGGTIKVAGPGELLGTWQVFMGEENVGTYLQFWFHRRPSEPPDFISSSFEPFDILGSSTWITHYEEGGEDTFVFKAWSTKWLELSRR